MTGKMPMKAVIYDRFGKADVLRLSEVAMPAAADNGVVVAMHATSVNVIDIRSRLGLLSPLVNKKFPKIPGADLAGIVASAGPKATSLKVGDRVFGATNVFKGGAFAEFVAVPEAALAKMPPSMSFEDAATLPIAGLAALYSLREMGNVGKGSRVLIYGSSGATGLFAIQLAKYFGANVTAVSGTGGVEAARAMGADVTIDYKAGPVRLEGPFDIIVDYAGVLDFRAARFQLAARGRFINASPTIPKVIGSKIANVFRRQKNQMLMTAAKSKDLAFLASLVEAGTLKVTIAKSYPLSEAKQAFLHHEAGGTVGKVVVRAEAA
jgi:NADPH:quinone reductase-like Zn-dependent oxidoreductase